MGVSFHMALLASCFQGSHFTQALQVSLGLAELGSQARLDEVPGHGWTVGPAAYAHNVHVIVLHTLPGREVVVNDGSVVRRKIHVEQAQPAS
jgi:hypothetical protein